MSTKTLSILMLSGFSAMFGLGIISPFLPELAADHGANGFWIGMIFAGFGISRGIITPFIGRASDRYGRKIFVVSGLFIFTAISLCYPRANNVYLLTAVRLVHGLAAGMILPIVMAYVGEIAKGGSEGRTTGALNTVLYMGVAAGPLLGGELAERYGFDAVFYTMSALGALTLLVVIFLLPEGKTQAPMSEQEKTGQFNILIKHGYVKTLLIMALISASLFAVFMSFMPSVAVKDFINIAHIGIIVSASIFVAGVLQVPFGRVADRHDRFGKLLQCSAGVSVSMMALFALPLCPDFKALLLSGCIIGFGAAISAPALSSLFVGMGKKAGMGSWMGIFFATMSVGLVIAPLVAGIIMDRLGIDSVFYLFGIFGFLGLLLCVYYILRKERGFQRTDNG